MDEPVYWSEPMPFRTKLPNTTLALGRLGSTNAPSEKPAGVKIWMRSRPRGASATTKLPS